MTPSLYHMNAYATETTAQVVEVLELEGRYHIRLDETVFYPEGGGQPCDMGTIDGIPVLAVYENESGIYHVLAVLPHTNRPVSCQLDWTRRFDHMQQHSGQHLLSAVMDHLYDAATVGFRLTEDYVTIDLEKRLTEAEVAAAELEANRLIWRDKPIKAYWPEAEVLATLPLRKRPQVAEDIRIVEVDGYDYSPCCGTHVNTSGEIGLIKISRFENYKSGIRLEFRCGRRALAYFSQLVQITQTLGRELSTPPEGLIPAFEKYRSEKEETKENLQLLQNALQRLEADSYMASAENCEGVRVIARVADQDMKALKNMASLLAQNPSTVVLLGTAAEGKAQILLQRSADLEQLDMKALFTEVAPLINARGGGNAGAAQGGGDIAAALPACIEAARDKVVAEIGKKTAP